MELARPPAGAVKPAEGEARAAGVAELAWEPAAGAAGAPAGAAGLVWLFAPLIAARLVEGLA